MGEIWDSLVAIGTVIIALGTIGLALATYSLARQTRNMVEATRATVEVSTQMAESARRQVDAAQEQALLTRSALEASIQPLLVDVPPNMFVTRERIRFDEAKAEFDVEDRSELVLRDEPSFVLCSIPFRNVGTGVALVRGLGLRFGQGESGWSGRASRAVISPSEITRLIFAVPKDRPELTEHLPSLIQGQCVVEIAYTNADGTHPLITRAVTLRDAFGQPRVRQIFLLRPGEPEPFAGSTASDL